MSKKHCKKRSVKKNNCNYKCCGCDCYINYSTCPSIRYAQLQLVDSFKLWEAAGYCVRDCNAPKNIKF